MFRCHAIGMLSDTLLALLLMDVQVVSAKCHWMQYSKPATTVESMTPWASTPRPVLQCLWPTLTTQ